MTGWMMNWQIDPLLRLVIAGFIIVVLARALMEKALAYPIFVANLRDYRLLPAAVAPSAAAMLVVAEAAAAVSLLVPALGSIGAILAAALFAIYAAAMAAVLLAGRSEIECGCGGEGQAVSWALVARNLVLVALAASLLLPASGRPVGWANTLVGAAAIFVVYLLLAIAEKAIGNAAAIRRLDSRSHS